MMLAALDSSPTSAEQKLIKHYRMHSRCSRMENGKQMNIIELPMPDQVIYEDQRLPASYANFYTANKYVVVPTFRCKQDDKVLDMLQGCFSNRKVVGIDSTDIIWGLGSFHCLSQQEPEI